MPADCTARWDPAACSSVQKCLPNSVNLNGQEGCMLDQRHSDSNAPRTCSHQVHAETVPTGSRWPNGIHLPTRKMSSDQGNYFPYSKKPLPCLLYLRDITLPVVSYTSNQQSVVWDPFRNVYRSSKCHSYGVSSFILFLAEKQMALNTSVKPRIRVTHTGTQTFCKECTLPQLQVAIEVWSLSWINSRLKEMSLVGFPC